MSLVSDALRKARQEAALRDAESRGMPPPPVRGGAQTPAHRGSTLVIGALLGLIAALTGGATAWWLLHDAEEAPARPSALHTLPPTGHEPATRLADGNTGSEPEARAEPAQPGQSGSALPVADGRPDVDPPQATPGSTQDAEASPEASPGPAEVTETRPPIRSETARAGELDLQSPESPPPGSDSASDDPLVFDVEANLDGVTLGLDYIVSRSDDPFAEINGQEVHLGWSIEGYEVVAIERDRVILEGPLGTVTIRIP